MAGQAQSKVLQYAATAGICALTVYLLVVGEQLFQPLVIAVVFWFLINVLASLFQSIRFGRFRLFRPVCILLAILVLALLLSMIVQFISGSLNDLGSAARIYEANLQIYWSRFPFSDSLPADGLWQNISDWLDISTLVTAVALTFTGFAADGVLIFIYTVFVERINFFHIVYIK